MKTLTIGNVELNNPFILGPMAGVSDLPFRFLCHEMGAGLVCSEMISAKAIYYNNRNTGTLMEMHPDEGPVSMQLFGSEPKLMAEMAKRIEEEPFAILDLNMGCPVPKVVKNGEGSALMKDPKLAEDIVRAIVNAIKKPVTVKFRKGFDDDHVNAVEFAKRMEDAGAAAVAVHGRTREQYYRGLADWDIVRQVKEAVTIPVIGSGDITDTASARAMQEETGCDGLMIARAAQGNPWIFRELSTSDWQSWGSFQTKTGELSTINEKLTTLSPNKCENTNIHISAEDLNAIRNHTLNKPTVNEVCDMLRRHAKLQIQYKGELAGMREMRKHAAWYVTGYPNAAKLRGVLSEISSYEELDALLHELLGA